MSKRGWSAKAKALRFGAYWNAIAFREGQWWAIDYTGGRNGPISRKEAYMIAVSYMNAQEVAQYDAGEAKAELRAEFAAQRRRPKQAAAPEDK